jgi:hypothetical protein
MVARPTLSVKPWCGRALSPDCELKRQAVQKWTYLHQGRPFSLPVADLAKVALVAAAYPLTISNSMATCLWDTPVDYYPQSPSCPDFDYRRFDFSQVYKSCGPPGVHSERCCDTVWALSSIIYFERMNRTRVTLFEVRACDLSFGVLLGTGCFEIQKSRACRLKDFDPTENVLCTRTTLSSLFRPRVVIVPEAHIYTNDALRTRIHPDFLSRPLRLTVAISIQPIPTTV